MILALCGHKFEGKDTAFELIKKSYPNKKFINLKFANAMKEIACLLFNWKMEQFEDPVWKETVQSDLGFSPRKFLEWFGTDVMQNQICEQFPLFKNLVGKRIWALKTIKEAKLLENEGIVVITDMRFPHEQETLKGLGISIKLIRPELEYSDSFVEKQVDLVECDYTIFNPENDFETYRTNLTSVIDSFIYEE